jgi:hypothetical protein
MNENEIAYKALKHLEDRTGLTGHWKPIKGKVDGNLYLTIAGKNIMLQGEMKRELRQHHLPFMMNLAREQAPLIIIAENIFPGVKEMLREANIGYLDTAGNIYLRTPDQYIWIDGNKVTPEKKTGSNRAFTKTGLKTVFQLLIDKQAINKPYRYLAEASEVALGTIKNTIEGLREAGFILQVNGKTMMLQNKRVLLDRWITGYGELLKPGLKLGTFKFWKNENVADWHNLKLERNEGNWSGEPAGELLTNYLKPKRLTLYTKEFRPLMKRWVLIPQLPGDIEIYKKFWKDEQNHTDTLAPEVLVYADLVLTGDPRCLETAEKIYDKYLRNEFEGN